MTWYLAAAHEPKNDLNGNLYQPCPTRTETPHDFQSAFPNLRTKYILEETWGKFKKLYVAESGFDPPTSGLWAQHASSAPLCWKLKELISDKIRAQKYDTWFYGNGSLYNGAGNVRNGRSPWELIWDWFRTDFRQSAKHCPVWGSNSRPSDYETDALPTALTRLMIHKKQNGSTPEP